MQNLLQIKKILINIGSDPTPNSYPEILGKDDPPRCIFVVYINRYSFAGYSSCMTCYSSRLQFPFVEFSFFSIGLEMAKRPYLETH